MAERGVEQILEFREATLRPSAHDAMVMEDVSLRLGAGEAAMVLVEEGREHLPLADAAEGLLAPVRGEVLFCGARWEELSPARQTERRGRVRRVFEQYGWVSNLDVLENICLAECYHTGRPLAEIVAEAEALAREFGLDGVPAGRPTRVAGPTLRKLEWVRALMGRPALLLLERPMLGAMRADLERLAAGVARAMNRGAAVVWLAADARELEALSTNVRRYLMEGPRLRAVEREQT